MINSIRRNLYNNSYNKNLISKISRKNAKIIATTLPFAATPIVFYEKSAKIRTKQRKINKYIEQSDHNKTNNVTWNEKQSRKILKENGITKKSEQDKLLKEDGKLNKEGQKISHKGAPQEDTLQENAVFEDNNSEINNLSDTCNEEIEILQHDINEINNDIGDLLENLPVIGNLISELVPGMKFIKPFTSFVEGDDKKAVAGVISRGIDVLFSPVKLFMATTSGVVSAIVGLSTNDKKMGFLSGYKGFYNFWANMRDNAEDAILGRENKEEKRERLEREIAEKRRILEEKKAKLQEIQRQKIEEERQKREIEIYLEQQNANNKVIQNQINESPKARQRRIKREQIRAEEKAMVEAKKIQTEADIIRIKEQERQRKIEEERYLKESVSIEKQKPFNEELSYQDKLTLLYLGKNLKLLAEYTELKPDADLSELITEIDNKKTSSDANGSLQEAAKIIKEKIAKIKHK